MVYNSFGVINESAIEKFHFIINLGKHVHLEKKGGPPAEDGRAVKGGLLSEATNFFPHLVWLLRDFSLDFAAGAGASSSADEYMEKALLPREAWAEDSMKCVVRRKFREVFPRRNCFTLVRPVHDEKLLRNIEDVPYEDLRREFRVQLSDLLRFVGQRAPVKTLRGKPLNGKAFCLFLRQLVDSLNSDSFPGISTVNERLARHQRKAVVQRAQAQLAGRLEQMREDLPTSEADLGERLEEARLEAMAEMQSQWVCGNEWRAAVSELRKLARPLETALFEENMDKSRALCSSAAAEAIEAFRAEVARTATELEQIEPRVEDWGSSSAGDLESIREQSRQSVVDAQKGGLKRRLSRKGSLGGKVVG